MSPFERLIQYTASLIGAFLLAENKCKNKENGKIAKSAER